MDELEFKIKTAAKFLAKIPDFVPARQEQELEENTQGFLFFASGGIEIVKRSINDKFGIFDRKNVFYIHGLRKNLSDKGAQKRAKTIISNYFSTPRQLKSRIDVSKSSLWRLQSLRNQAMHGNMINIHGKTMTFSYTIHQGQNTYYFVQKTQNPHRYFTHMLDNLEKFTTQIDAILQST
ncbi:MAG: hypothetical protein EB163_01625 [Nitrososphaeria archaeon]|nr:hypothetical protein [Nitrososphaeria archaeon]NDB50814.1 hypothetical protein [Nitrosopumilaceae archaeon]NDB88401.1 hypothetical protein [Nitrososphaerota archaeon]NDB45982.1 hypothetical protein [Nitrososphaeria archaeon]NDB89566.1 hypothetical protein [Nitrososphaerota archaeon]